MMGLPSWAGWAIGIGATLVVLVAGLPWLIQPALRLLFLPRYGFRVVGQEHVPKDGPALIASNHITWIDGFLLAAIFPRPGKALINAAFIDKPVLRWLARRAGLIALPASGPRAQRAAIEAVRAAFDRGEVVLIFPEAQLSRTGLMGPFYRGLEVMMKGRDAVPVVPAFLGNLWGSVFSFAGGRSLGKWPRGWRRTVVVVFGPPVPPPVTAFAVRQAVQEAAVRAIALQPGPSPPLLGLDESLPCWHHEDLGRLTVSTSDFAGGGISQVGFKPGTVGQAAPGVALRAVDDDGRPVPPDVNGLLQAMVVGRPEWVETGHRGSIDRDGFVTLH